MNLLQAEGRRFPWDILKTKPGFCFDQKKASNLLYWCEVFSASSSLQRVPLCRKVPTSQGAAGFRCWGWRRDMVAKLWEPCTKVYSWWNSPQRCVEYSHILPSPFPSPSPALWHWGCRANLPLCVYTKMWHLICVAHRKNMFLLTFWMLQQGYRYISALSSSLELAWPGWALFLNRELSHVSTEMK